MGKKILTILKVLIITYVITGLLMVLSALLMLKFNLSGEPTRLFVMIIYGITTIVGGCIYGKLQEKRRLLSGAFMGLMYFVILVIVSLIVNKGFTDGLQENIISMIICVAGGSIGGIIS